MSFFSWLCVSGITIKVRYPRAPATSASPMPVLPAVASTTSPPGLMSPRFSASRIICLAGRSFTDWPGFMNSALPRMVQPVASDARLSLISGVPPIASTTPSRMAIGIRIRLVWRANLKEARRGYKAGIPPVCHPGRAISAFTRVFDALWRDPGSIQRGSGRDGSRVSLRSPGTTTVGSLQQQPRRLLHDRWRGGVDVLDQRLDRVASHRPDLEIALGGVGQEIPIPHRVSECLAQHGDALGWHTRRHGKRPGHHLPAEDQLEDRALLVVAGKVHDQRDVRKIRVL